MLKEITLDEINKSKYYARNYFKDDEGKPIELTDGQAQVFSIIVFRKFPRNHLMTYTQYGKSFTVALAILTRAANYPEKWCIVAGKEKHAKIIMGYVIQHAFDNAYMQQKIEINENEKSIERLRRERSKKRINFKHTDGTLGEIFILSADSRNKQAAGESVMGFGAPNVVLDEAALIDDDIEAKIFRMLGGHASNFYLKIGNPFRRNHFLKSYENDKYFKLDINYSQGIKENRISREFIEEARNKPLFDILYANKFPDADAMDEKGYVPLLRESDIRVIDDPGRKQFDCLGIDPAGLGTDLTAWCGRSSLYAEIIGIEKVSNSMTITLKTITYRGHYTFTTKKIYIDNLGEGANVSAELIKSDQRLKAEGINVGEHPEDKEQFANLKAELYWMAKEWLCSGGHIIRNKYTDQFIKELLSIKWRTNPSRKIQIMTKDEMRRQGIPSPNLVEAFILTFCHKSKKSSNQSAVVYEVKGETW